MKILPKKRRSEIKVDDWIDEDPEIGQWFAWFPVVSLDGTTYWLETVERGRTKAFNRISGKYQKAYDYYGLTKVRK